MTAEEISIIIPTFQRPDDLIAAARTVFQQTVLDKLKCTLIIVDNDPSASASESISVLRDECPDNLTLLCAHEPRAGVANARNRGIDLVQTDLVVFLDDDQSIASPDWLEKLYKLHKELKPTVVFGPVLTVLPNTVTKHKPYFQKFFERSDTASRGFIPNYHGACNTLIDLRQVPDTRPLFDTDTNDTGGEDDILFEMIKSYGGTFAWEPEARVYERVPQRRAKLSYTLRRAFVYGQAPTVLACLKRQYHKVLFWMCVGIAKSVWHGSRAGFGFIFGRANRAEQLDLAVRGIGKLFYRKTFTLYGAPALRDPAVIRQDKITLAPTD